MTGRAASTTSTALALALLAEGCSNRLIADRLFIAEATVKGYVSALLEKLDARSRLQAVVNASERGLV